jgi:hypothetical protein
MQRLRIVSLSFTAFGVFCMQSAPADAQPAPPAADAPPPAADPPPPAADPPPPALPAADAPPPAASPVPAERTPAPELVNPPEPAKAEPTKAPEELAKKLAVGKDSKGAWVVPGVLLQGWYVHDVTTGRDAAGAETTVSSLSTFRIRRAEISLSGEVIPKFLKYRVMFDAARVRDTLNTVGTAVDATGKPVVVTAPASALSALQDFYFTIQSPFADVSIGQFKIPVSWEGFNSSSRILLPERAFATNLLGDKRDLGLRVEKTFEKAGYVAGIFNGNTLNNLDNNNQKDLTLRLEAYPVKGMTIAGVVYNSVGYRTRAGTKDRWEADFRYDTGAFLVQAELIRASDVRSNDATECVDAGGKCSSQGGYLALAYTVKDVGAGNWKGNFQPVVRFGYWDNDTDHKADDATLKNQVERLDFEVGANYYLRSHEAKLQLSYDRQQFTNPEPAAGALVARPAINEVILAGQVAF